MSEDALDESTIRPGPGARPRQPFRVAALTVLQHPDPVRVGQVSRLVPLLSGRPVALSRTEPDFADPGATGGRPLGDAGLSRSPVTLEPAPDGGLTLTPGGVDLRVDDAPAQRASRLDPARLEGGVVLTLGGRVVLLLHRLGPPAPPVEALGLVGASEALERVRADVLRVADLDVPVLLRGETGTGKELVAASLHARSLRARGPFLPVNMAALPAATAASELFGHVAGAFTGAVRARTGLFVEASGGTLFLDEIADAPGDVQTMLLRALESREVQPVGASRATPVDVRLVAATDADLESRMASGRFREQLFHRLAGYQLSLPPLRERRDDLGRLLQHFLREELRATGELDRLDAPPRGRAPWLPAEVVARLARHAWPGNVRQLRNVVRQMVISSRGLPHLRLDAEVMRTLEPRAAPASSAEPPASTSADRRGPVTDALLVETLRANGWRTGATAGALGISRTTLYALIDRSPSVRKAADVSPEELRACLDSVGGDLDAAAERLQVSKRGLQLRLRQERP